MERLGARLALAEAEEVWLGLQPYGVGLQSHGVDLAEAEVGIARGVTLTLYPGPTLRDPHSNRIPNRPSPAPNPSHKPLVNRQPARAPTPIQLPSNSNPDQVMARVGASSARLEAAGSAEVDADALRGDPYTPPYTPSRHVEEEADGDELAT